jgi:Papain fold toxin 1, glutamine deamidase
VHPSDRDNAGVIIGSTDLLIGMHGVEAPLLAEVNPGFCTQRVRQVNCENAALAVNEWLAGNPVSALPEGELPPPCNSLPQRARRRLRRILQFLHIAGNSARPRASLDQAYGGRFEATTLPNLQRLLLAEGEGARGIVRMNFSDGRNHHFNAAVRDGRVLLIDGQVNRIAALDAVQAADPCTLYDFAREQADLRAVLVDTDNSTALRLQMARSCGGRIAAALALHDGASLSFMRTDTLQLREPRVAASVDLPCA